MDKSFKTDDIQLSSYLLTQNVKYLGVQENYSGHFNFCFSNEKLCVKLKQDFQNNALAPAMELFSRREMLLSEIKQKNRDRKAGYGGTEI